MAIKSRLSPHSGRANALFVAALPISLLLEGCSGDTSLATADSSHAPLEQALKPISGRGALTRFLYQHSSARAKLVNADNASIIEFAALNKIHSLDLNLQGKRVELLTVEYSNNNLPNYAAVIRTEGNRKLFFYNGGHQGLPLFDQRYAIDFLNSILADGYDLVLASMPLYGLNEISPTETYWAVFHGQAGPSNFDNALISPWVHLHSIYQTISDADNFLHFFTDTAFIFLLAAAPARIEYGLVSKTVSMNISHLNNYETINYLGLSGGATIGLPICGLVKFDKCILAAGFLPLYLRAQQQDSWGDVEQIADSIYGQFSYEALMTIASATSKVTYVYNSHDPCCFADPIASKFKTDFPQFDIRIVTNYEHSFDPAYMREAFHD